DQEQIQQFASTVPIPGFDPNAIDVQALVSMNPAQLLQLLPALLPILQQLKLGGGANGANLPPGLAALLGGDANGAGGKGGAQGGGQGGNNFLRDFIRERSGGKLSDAEIDQALGGMGQQGGSGRGGRGGNGDGGNANGNNNNNNNNQQTP